MKNRTIPVYAVLLFALAAPRARADITDLYDLALSVQGGISADWQDLASNDPTTIVSTTMACCGDASGGTPGIGNLSYTFNPGAGTYKVSLYFDYDVSTPFFNEYGIINNAGSAQAGISYEIFNANSTSSNIVLFGANGIALGETYGLADNVNHVPGTTSNYSANCVVAGCNADVGMALTYNFTLAAGQEAVLTAQSFAANPGGFSLETVHPVDLNNPTAAAVYLTGAYTIQPVGNPAVPEPSAWLLLGTVLAFLGVRGARRKANV